MKNQTLSVNRGLVSEHKYIFFIVTLRKQVLKKFQDNGNSNKCTVNARGARKKCLLTRVLGDTGCGLK